MSRPRFSLTSLCSGACLLAAVGCGGGPAATPETPEVVAPTVEPPAENPSESNPEKKVHNDRSGQKVKRGQFRSSLS